MEIDNIIEAILFASGEPFPVKRLCNLLGADETEVLTSAKRLADAYVFESRGIRLLVLGENLQLCSAPEYQEYVRRALEIRKPPRLSSAALEVLAVCAYYQPVTRAYIEQLRGVDSSYTVGLLADRGLIEPCGRLDVPGKPVIYRTTNAFLRSFGISKLEELPKLTADSGKAFEFEQLSIEKAIENLKRLENN